MMMQMDVPMMAESIIASIDASDDCADTVVFDVPDSFDFGACARHPATTPGGQDWQQEAAYRAAYAADLEMAP